LEGWGGKAVEEAVTSTDLEEGTHADTHYPSLGVAIETRFIPVDS
jgi:hypothetical protein